MKCVKCGAGALKLAEGRVTRKVAGQTFVGLLPAQVCQRCGEQYVAGSVLKRFELMIASRLARAGGDRSEAFRFMRRALGMKAVDLAELLGLAPETISRWETGERSPDRGWYAVLVALISDKIDERTTIMDLLTAKRGPRRSEKAIEIRLPGAA